MAPKKGEVRWHRTVDRIHKTVYLRSRGWLGWNLGGVPMLLLFTIGRRTSIQRVATLAYVKVDGDPIVIGSNAGNERPPGWVFNLRARPNCAIQVGPRRHAVVAEELSGAERDRVFDAVKRRIPIYIHYDKTTDRQIPLFRLRRQRQGS